MVLARSLCALLWWSLCCGPRWELLFGGVGGALPYARAARHARAAQMAAVGNRNLISH